MLKQEWDQASGAAHILLVRLTQGGDQRGFLNGYPIGIGNSRARKNYEKRCPISERQTHSDERDECSGV
jgi:hypothetical protein